MTLKEYNVTMHCDTGDEQWTAKITVSATSDNDAIDRVSGLHSRGEWQWGACVGYEIYLWDSCKYYYW